MINEEKKVELVKLILDLFDKPSAIIDCADTSITAKYKNNNNTKYYMISVDIENTQINNVIQPFINNICLKVIQTYSRKCKDNIELTREQINLLDLDKKLSPLLKFFLNKRSEMVSERASQLKKDSINNFNEMLFELRG